MTEASPYLGHSQLRLEFSLALSCGCLSLPVRSEDPLLRDPRKGKWPLFDMCHLRHDAEKKPEALNW